MKFKVGDKIKGLNNNNYSVTNGNMYLGKVEETDGNYMKIVVLEHRCLGLIGKTYCVLNSEDRFKIVKRENRNFFKSLPNDFTGTLEIENGYIVEKEILDDAEKEYLLNVIKPFKDKVKFIRKCNALSGEFIHISIINETGIFLPNFKKNTMYEGMETDKKYTLKELGLDE